MAPVKHVFVLMLENRSFDHFFGLSDLHGLSPPPAGSGFGAGARDRSPEDPPHEFGDVAAQIDDGRMDRFSATGRLGFERSGIPVISTLAANYLLFDNWFSSMPGPTWPNRFFVHAGSSGGLTDSPAGIDAALATHVPSKAFRFQNGSIFDRLDGGGRRWRVYSGDVTPQVLAVHGMTTRIFDPARFRPIYPQAASAGDFAADVQAGEAYGIDYTFIEPRYGIEATGRFQGDSQHPQDSVSAGEGLVKYVYESLRNSPLWTSSVLLITWDEHGGFYDRQPPGPATVPGDAALNFKRGTRNQPHPPEFAFDRLGVRVPAILASPFAPRGLASQCGPSTGAFDHASVVRSVRELVGLTAPLTARDAVSPSWWSLLTDAPRADADCPAALPAPALNAAAVDLASLKAVDAKPPGRVVDSLVAGFSLIAYDLDQALARRTGQRPLSAAPRHDLAFSAAARAKAIVAGVPDSHLAVHSYIAAVSDRVRQHQRELNGG
jgi:phospholipase C